MHAQLNSTQLNSNQLHSKDKTVALEEDSGAGKQSIYRTFGKNGFTLVELSIVIVIIGLIIAGVTAGQSLVKNTKLRSVIEQASQFRAASNAFKIQYNSIPGDIVNASSYWGTNCDATPANCNGNGNKVLDVGSGSTSEYYRFWQHLTLAGLLPGNYTGTAASGTLNCVLNTNTPAGQLNNSGWFASSIVPSYPGWKNFYSVSIGKCVGSAVPNTSLLTPADAYSIDLKSDDGYPSTGQIYSNGGLSNSGACKDTSILLGLYTISNTGIACYMFFPL